MANTAAEVVSKVYERLNAGLERFQPGVSGVRVPGQWDGSSVDSAKAWLAQGGFDVESDDVLDAIDSYIAESC